MLEITLLTIHFSITFIAHLEISPVAALFQSKNPHPQT